MNRTALIKIAAELDYDLTPKSVDAKGNPVKRLVPVDPGRDFNPSAGEVHPAPLPNFDDVKSRLSGKDFYNPADSGFNTLKRKGIITPAPYRIDPRLKQVYYYPTYYEENEKHNPASRKRIYDDVKAEYGMLDLDKARVRQLAGNNPSPYDLKLAEAIVRKSAERARQERYNRLSARDKKNYDAVAKFYGFNPHYSTMSLPYSLNRLWKKNNVKSPDVLYHKTLGEKRPLFYDANADVPGYSPGTTSFMLSDEFSRYNEDPENKILADFESYDNLNRLGLANPLLRDMAQGKVYTANILHKNPIETKKTNERAGYHPRYVVVPKDPSEEIYFTEDARGEEKFPTIVMSNIVSPHTAGVIESNDFPVNPEEDRSVFKGFAHYSLPTLDHEAIHAMNRGNDYDRVMASQKYKDDVENLEEIIRDEGKVGPEPDIIENMEDYFAYRDKLRKLALADPRLKPLFSSDYSVEIDDENGISNGLYARSYPNPYASTDPGEHTRSLSTIKGLVENYLKETLPPQMEARGELAGMTEDEQIDAISDRVVEMANNSEKFKEILRNHNILSDKDGAPDWFIEDSALGGISRDEAYRAIHGFWNATPTIHRLRQDLSDEDKELLDEESGNRDYRPVSDKWIDELLQLIVNNNKDYESLA